MWIGEDLGACGHVEQLTAVPSQEEHTVDLERDLLGVAAGDVGAWVVEVGRLDRSAAGLVAHGGLHIRPPLDDLGDPAEGVGLDPLVQPGGSTVWTAPGSGMKVVVTHCGRLRLSAQTSRSVPRPSTSVKVSTSSPVLDQTCSSVGTASAKASSMTGSRGVSALAARACSAPGPSGTHSRVLKSWWWAMVIGWGCSPDGGGSLKSTGDQDW